MDDVERDEGPDWPLPLTWEKWALAMALHIEREHGELGPIFIAERISACALDDDAKCVAMWKEIAVAFDGLRSPK